MDEYRRERPADEGTRQTPGASRAAAAADAAVARSPGLPRWGGCTSCIQFTNSLAQPGFNPCAIAWKPARFQPLRL
jgi:hypothetical protein